MSAAFSQMQMQNNRLWIFGDQTAQLTKVQLDDQNSGKPPYIITDCYTVFGQKSRPKRMLVTRDGLHCFFVSERAIYYNFFHSERLQPLNIVVPLSFLSIDLVKDFEGDGLVQFGAVIGSQEGQILHGQIQINTQTGEIFDQQELKQFQSELQVPDCQPITEIKLYNNEDIFLLIAVTDKKLY